jgi:hypothetical protein
MTIHNKYTILKKRLLLAVAAAGAVAAYAQTGADTTDLDFAVKQVEENYSGFIDKMSTAESMAAYETMKQTLYSQVKNGSLSAVDAVGGYLNWFGDAHLWSPLWQGGSKNDSVTAEYSACSREYDPEPVATKVDDATFLIRYPACDDYVPVEWSERAVASYLQSGCDNLILDIRGNGGGSDYYFRPYISLLYDTPGLLDGVDMRNTPTNVAHIGNVAAGRPWVDDLLRKMRQSTSEFVTMSETDTLRYAEVSAYPKRAALIVDGNVASSGEQLTLELRNCSRRTVIYGRDNTKGCLDYSNVRGVNLPVSNVTIHLPMSRSKRLPGRGIDKDGIAPDVRIMLPLPAKLTDNVDEWVEWVANDLRSRQPL